VEHSRTVSTEQTNQLKETLLNPTKKLPDRIALPYQNGVAFVALADILYCEADDTYTKFFLADGQHYLASRTLRDVQELLEDQHFLRVHRQYLINLHQIKKFVRGEGNYLVMTNGQSIPSPAVTEISLKNVFGGFDKLPLPDLNHNAGCPPDFLKKLPKKFIFADILPSLSL